jgi:hypothetical protein
MATETERRSDYDDVADDAASAYKEATGRAVEAAPEPNAVEPASTPAASGPAPGDAGKPAANRDAGGRFVTKGKSDDKGAEGSQPERVGKDDGAQADAGRGREGKPDGSRPGAEPAAADKAEGQGAAPVSGPPPSWSVPAKAAWDKLPESVRADIAKRETEMQQGLAALRDYKDLKPYAERAQREGTTVAKALDHYVKMEDVCRKNIGQGLAVICQNFGLNQQQAAHLFGNLARQLGGSAPTIPGAANSPGGQAPALPADDPLLSALAPVLQPLQSKLSALEGQITSRAEADRKASAQQLGQAIERFASDPKNRFFPELEETITRFFETGMVPLTGNPDNDLRAAYDLAAYQHPEVREALIEQRLQEQIAAQRKKEQEEADRAKHASRSITGSRLPGTTIDVPPAANGFDEIEAIARAAYRMHSQH